LRPLQAQVKTDLHLSFAHNVNVQVVRARCILTPSPAGNRGKETRN